MTEIEERKRKRRRIETESKAEYEFVDETNWKETITFWQIETMEDEESLLPEMSEERAREMAQMTHEAEIDETELILAVEWIRREVSEYCTIHHDCNTCWKSLAPEEDHNPDCSAEERESNENFIQRQLERLDRGFQKLDEKRREEENEKLRMEVDQLRRELGQTKGELVAQREDKNVAKNLLKDISKQSWENGKEEGKEDMRKKLEEIEIYFGEDWNKIVIESNEGQSDESSTNWTFREPYEGIEERRRAGLTMDEMRRRFGHGEYHEIDVEEETEERTNKKGKQPADKRKIVVKKNKKVGNDEPTENQNQGSQDTVESESDSSSTTKKERESRQKQGQDRKKKKEEKQSKADEKRDSSSESTSQETKVRRRERRKRRKERKEKEREDRERQKEKERERQREKERKEKRKERKAEQREVELEISTDSTLESSEEEELIARMAEQQEGDKVAVYPGLDEIEEELVLKHKKGGHVIGGNLDLKVVKELLKLTENVKFGQKDRPHEGDFVAYLRHERDFVTCMENLTSRETTIYDIVATFC